MVLAHAGAFGDGHRAAGEIVDEARQMDDAVDVVIAGHTHSELNLRVGGKLIVEALSYGTAFDRVRLTVDRTSGDVVAKSALVVATRHGGIRPDPELATLVERHRQAVAPLAERVVGHAAGALDNAAVDRIAVRSERAWAGADLAFLNPGNTRSEIGAGPITYAEAAEVQAYEHPVWRLRMRGADLLEAMAEQPGLLVSGPARSRPAGHIHGGRKRHRRRARAVRARHRARTSGNRSRCAHSLAVTGPVDGRALRLDPPVKRAAHLIYGPGSGRVRAPEGPLGGEVHARAGGVERDAGQLGCLVLAAGGREEARHPTAAVDHADVDLIRGDVLTDEDLACAARDQLIDAQQRR